MSDDPRPEQRRLGGPIVRHTIVYVIAGGLQRGIPVLSLPVVTRLLEPDQFGLVALTTAAATLIAAFMSLGINAAVVRLYHEDAPTGPARWAALVRVQLLLSAAAAVLLVATGPWWGPLLSAAGWSPVLAFGVLLAISISWNSLAMGLLRAAGRPIAFGANGLLQAVVGVGAGIALATRFDASGYVAGLAAGALAASAIGIAQMWRPADWDRASIRSGLLLSWPFLLHRISLWVLALSDRVIIERLIGAEAVGRYNAGYVVAGALLVFVDSAQSAWAPRYFADRDPAKASIVGSLVRAGDAFAVMASAAMILAAPVLVTLIAPASYDVPPAILALVGAAVMPQVGYFVWIAVLLDNKRTKGVGVASASAAAVNIALNLLLVPRWGIEGAAAATAVAYALQATIVGAYANRLVPRPLAMSKRVLVWVLWGSLLSVASIPSGPSGFSLRTVLVLIAGGYAIRTAQRIRTGLRTSASPL